MTLTHFPSERTFLSVHLLAYIDPGTGAVVLQLLVAALATAAFYFRKSLKVLMFWRRGKDPGEQEETTEQAGR